MTRSAFDQSLAEIREDILQLAEMAEEALTNSLSAFQNRNVRLAEVLNENDSRLNTLRFEIEERCYTIIALQQPNATDMRITVGAATVATNLERIGDYAAGIARLTLRVPHGATFTLIDPLPQMVELGKTMLKDSVQAFIDRNVELASQVAERDREMDGMYEKLNRDLLSSLPKDPVDFERATYLMWIGHNLERVGDRAANICERAVYVATGVLKEYN